MGEIRILIIEDNAADAELAEYSLRSAGIKFISKVVETERDCRRALSEFSPDIVVSDYDMPTFNGADALSIVKELRPDLPFILYTGAMGEERAIEILTGGATDYVMKNRLTRLVPAVERALKEAEELRKRKEVEAERDSLLQALEARVQERTAEVRRKEAELNEAQRIAHIGSWHWDAQTDVTTGSDELLRVFGFDPVTDSMPNFQDQKGLCYPVEDWERINAAASESLRTGTGYELDVTIIRKDGSKISAITRSEVIRNARNEITGLLGTVQDITDRKRAEEEIRQLLDTVQQERDKLSSLIDSIRDEIWFADTNKNFTIANPSALHEFQIDADWTSVEKMAASLEVLRPDGSPRPVEESPALRALQGEVIRNEEEIIRTPATGEFRFRQVSSSPVKNAANEIIGSVSVVRDITESKRTEALLKRSEQRLRSASHAGRIGLFEWNITHNVTYWSPELYELYGLELNSAVNYESWLSIIHPEDRERMKRIMADLIEQVRTSPSAPYKHEFRVQHKDGAVLWVEYLGTLGRDGEDLVLRGAVRDISAIKKVQEELRESEEKYRNLFYHMAEEVHLWKLVRDNSGQIKTWRLVDVTPPTLKTWGFSSVDEIRGKTTDEIFGPGATEHYMPVVQKIMSEGVPYSYEDYFPNMDRHFRFTSVPLGDHFMTTGADITEIKKAVEELKKQSQS